MGATKVLRTMAFSLAAAVSSTVVFAADELSVDCPEFNTLPAVTMTLADGKLTVSGPAMNGVLPARVRYAEGTTAIAGVFAAGPMLSAMPDRAALDACWAKAIQDHAAVDDEDTRAFLLLSCQNSVAKTAAPIEVQATINLGLIELGQPDMGAEIARTYEESSTVTGKPQKLDEFPMRSCTVK